MLQAARAEKPTGIERMLTSHDWQSRSKASTTTRNSSGSLIRLSSGSLNYKLILRMCSSLMTPGGGGTRARCRRCRHATHASPRSEGLCPMQQCRLSCWITSSS